MTSRIAIQRDDSRERAILCTFLAQKLPPLPSAIQAEIGESTAALVALVLRALESVAHDQSIDPKELSVGLRAITGIAQRKADEIEKRMYRAGSNSGSSGTADTYSEIYLYLGAYMRTVASAADLDAEQCIVAFRTALKLHGMHLVDGDAKDRIRWAIEDAEANAARVLDEVYRSVPALAARLWAGEVSRPTSAQPGIQAERTSPESASAGHGKDRHQVFVSYSHYDKKWLAELQNMLKPLVRSGAIQVWDDTKIRPGSAWKDEIETALKLAKVAVLLVSSNFLASEFVAHHELPPLLRAAREDGLTIFWIYVSTCLYELTDIAEFQAAHDVSRALDRMDKPSRQAVLAEVCRHIKHVLS